MENYNIAVLLPCYNEEVAIKKVITDFQKYIPEATIYVYDNNSSDKTVEIAKSQGVCVRSETNQGKGHVVRRMFSDIDADIYVMCDGDDTYDASVVKTLVSELIDNNYDMVVGKRDAADGAYRPKHEWGNKMFNLAVQKLFGDKFSDIFSGYRIFSKRFVKSFPQLSSGFEIETELSVHALELNLPSSEIATKFIDRPEGSFSKLDTYKDGFKILKQIIILLKEEKPLKFFVSIGAICLLFSIMLAYPIFVNFIQTGLVPRFPTAFLCASIGTVSFISFACGLILDSVARARKEIKRLAYLRYKAPQK
jgi:glycosyltransferase involved in cell wall biosynthesis